ncbi:MAG: formylglycine-generating enzyme family protein [Steroidobacteraceae bacterium]|nr:formylglycine-generating enzyme family protein [Steroidobacteraceae bacterium]
MPRLRFAAAAAVLLAASPLAGAAEAMRPAGTVFRSCDGCPEMVVVPAGLFVMGTPGAASASGAARAESGPVVVRIPRAFAIGRHEVTRAQYARFIADTDHEPRPGCRNWDPALARLHDDVRRGWRDPATPSALQDDHPVTCVSFTDAQAYVQWLARKTGARYRLPSEAEWEYAARAGSVTSRPWGDDAASGCQFANVYDLTADGHYRLGWTPAGCRDGYPDLAPVGRFGANRFGLHDMIGNVREWVQDCATGSYEGRPTDARAWEWLGGCRERVLRGGSWRTPTGFARSAHRDGAAAEDRADDTGFRVALDLEGRGSAAEDR